MSPSHVSFLCLVKKEGFHSCARHTEQWSSLPCLDSSIIRHPLFFCTTQRWTLVGLGQFCRGLNLNPVKHTLLVDVVMLQLKDHRSQYNEIEFTAYMKITDTQGLCCKLPKQFLSVATFRNGGQMICSRKYQVMAHSWTRVRILELCPSVLLSCCVIVEKLPNSLSLRSLISYLPTCHVGTAVGINHQSSFAWHRE